ncbi:MAG: hypothetical protein Q7U08_02765, partial [Flavobacteriaceae bacterium]|nr:hypothetical protein [Flavobacteriaceae bacterium]
NKFHIKEYSEKQINQLLKKYFNSVELLNISANKDFLAHELIRLKKQKYTTLPFTLIIYPRIIRLFLLNFQKILFGKLIKIKNFIRNKKSIDIENRIFKSKFSIDDMLIDKNLIDATDLLVICKL